MATIGIKIKTAIIAADRTSLRKLIAKLDSSKLREQLDNKIDGEDHISLALRLGQRQIGLELLLRSLFEIDEWPYGTEEFTWLKLFDFIGDTTINKLQERLKHAKPFAIKGDIDLKSLAKNLKYLKVAYLLGAPCQEGKLLGDMILDAFGKKDYIIGRQRVGDLVKSKICRRFPLSVAKTAKWLSSEYDYTLELLQNYPDWFEDSDEHGSNILHYALASKEYTLGLFTSVWPKINKTTTEKLVNLILQKNDKGQIPLVLFLSKLYLKIPIEFHLAIKQLVDLGDTKTMDEVLATPELSYDEDQVPVKIFLHAFFMQHGYKRSPNALKYFGKVEDIGLFLHHVDKKGSRKSKKARGAINKKASIDIVDDKSKNAIPTLEPETPKRISIMTRVMNFISLLKNLAMTRVKNIFLFKNIAVTPVKNISLPKNLAVTSVNNNISPIPIVEPDTSNTSFEDLPTELVFHIAESLPPSDLFTFALCNKRLNNQIKNLMNGHEQFWKQYHQSHLRPVPELQTTHRDYVCDQFKLRSSWYNNKYSTITLPNDYTPLAMDENWLLMSDESQQYCYWNCRTHEIIESNVTQIEDPSEHAILNKYDSNSLPTIFDGRNIIRGNQVIPLNSCKDMETIMYNKTTPIDHRMLLRTSTSKNLVLNTEIDSIEYSANYDHWYNPFNETLISHNQSKFHVTDLRCGYLTSKYDTDLKCSYPKLQFADEHTMFYIDHKGAGFIDMRNFKKIYSVTLASHLVEKTFSKERAILVADSQLMVSWHLPSRKIEWIEPAVSQPTVANSRYLVMGTRNTPWKIVIRDYK